MRNIGESSSLVKAAMSVLVLRGGEAAGALSKLAEIWAGGRREEEREEAIGHSCPGFPARCWCGGGVCLVQDVQWRVGLGFEPNCN